MAHNDSRGDDQYHADLCYHVNHRRTSMYMIFTLDHFDFYTNFRPFPGGERRIYRPILVPPASRTTSSVNSQREWFYDEPLVVVLQLQDGQQYTN